MSALASVAKRTYRLLVSSRIALWLLIAWVALIVVWVLPFIIAGRPEDQVATIATEWLPFRVIYASLAAVNVLCALHRFTRDRARDWERALTLRLGGVSPSEATTDLAPDEVRTRLSSHGFKTRATRGEGVLMTRHMMSVYGGALFHAGIALVAAALLVNALTLSKVTFELIDGQSVADSFREAGQPKEQAALFRPIRNLVLKKVTPRFFGPYLLFERLDATVSEEGVLHSMSLARPLWIDPLTNLSIQDFDVAPRFVVLSEDGAVAQDSTVSMDLFPPGGDRTTYLASAKADISLRLYTDYKIRNGEAVSGSYNLKDVRFLLTAVSKTAGVSDRVVARRIVKVGDVLTVNDFKIRIAGLRTAGTFRVTRAPALPFVILSALVACVGLIARLFFRRVDVLVVASAPGSTYVAYEDIFGRESGERIVAGLLSGGGDGR